VASHDAARHETLGGEGREGLRERFGVTEFAEARLVQVAVSRAARGRRP